MDMGKKIETLRKMKGMTLEELGERVGVGKSTVRKWENGMIANMRRDKIAKIALRLMPQSVARILRLPPGQRVGILCRSRRFGELVHAVCSTYAEDAEIRQPRLLDEVPDLRDYLSQLSALVVPDGFESYCPAPILQQLRAFDAEHPLIRWRYQVDEGSMMYLTERIDRLREKKRI